MAGYIPGYINSTDVAGFGTTTTNAMGWQSMHAQLDVHKGVTCAGCNSNPLRGIRWRCQSCPQDPGHNVCNNCYKQGRHQQHPMQIVNMTTSMNEHALATGTGQLQDEANVHWTTCQWCMAYPIKGTLFTCTECPQTPSFDLCKSCDNRRRETQEHWHRFDFNIMPKGSNPPPAPGTWRPGQPQPGFVRQGNPPTVPPGGGQQGQQGGPVQPPPPGMMGGGVPEQQQQMDQQQTWGSNNQSWGVDQPQHQWGQQQPQEQQWGQQQSQVYQPPPQQEPEPQGRLARFFNLLQEIAQPEDQQQRQQGQQQQWSWLDNFFQPDHNINNQSYGHNDNSYGNNSHYNNNSSYNNHNSHSGWGHSSSNDSYSGGNDYSSSSYNSYDY